MRFIPVLLGLFYLPLAHSAGTIVKMKTLPETSFDLEGVVDGDKSQGFACSFGSFTAKVKGNSGDKVAVVLSGSGLLVNSGWLHTQVAENPAIEYLFEKTAGIKDGEKLSVICIGGAKGKMEPGKAEVEFYGVER